LKRTIDDFECAVDVTGRGPFLTLLHSVGLSTREGWRNQIGPLSDHFTVISFDFRGLGQSSAGRRPLTVDTYVDDLEVLLRSLDVKTTAVMGTSLGGAVAQAIGLKRPDLVSALVLVSTTCGHLPENQPRRMERIERIRQLGMSCAVEAQLANQFSPEFSSRRPDVIEWYRGHYLANDPGCYTAVLEDLGKFNTCSRLQSIACPTLIVAGDTDSSVVAGQHSLDSPIRLRGLIPQSNLAVIPGARHYPHIDHADAFNAVVLDYLKRHVQS
jgi:pimeloyl-ACP methyl ester carboxylesterase